VGKDGVITVEESSPWRPTWRSSRHAVRPRYLSAYFVNNRETMTTVLEDPYILIHDRRSPA